MRTLIRIKDTSFVGIERIITINVAQRSSDLDALVIEGKRAYVEDITDKDELS